MSQLDREMADLKAILDSMHGPGAASRKEAPVRRAG